jgi:hypothetical protein
LAFKIEKIKTKYKNSALYSSEKSASFYTPRFIDKTVINNKMKNIVFLTILVLGSCDLPVEEANIIFTGNNIITIDESKVSAVAVRGDRIIATGTIESVLEYQGQNTRLIKLGERALLPGFIDAHGHLSIVANEIELLNFSPPPVGTVKTIDDIVRLLQNSIVDKKIPKGEIIFGVGYDDSMLEAKRHPTKTDLDKASNEHPIIIEHVSGHLLVANSLALENAKISSQTTNPQGGVIRRVSGSNEPNGIMEETAMGLFPRSSAKMSEDKRRELRRKAIQLHASYGITTIQDIVGFTSVHQMIEEARSNPFPIDIVSYTWGNSLEDSLLSAVVTDQSYTGGFRNGGVKLMLDGSPQGRTAWLSQPYMEGPPDAKSDYVAYPSYPSETYRNRIAELLERQVQVIVHANGDQAIELMIDGIEESLKSQPIPDHRSVIIHAQLIRSDQLDRVKKLGIIPSYYAVHPFFWGDWHRISFGDERASFISPLQATIDRSIPFTIHNDAPVVPPDMMRLISIAVNRKTRSGYILGEDQRISVMEALYAVTQGAAYQYFEEDEKGSIAPGKRADLIILEKSPLQVDSQLLAEIKVVETFSRGKSVFKR